MNQPSKPAMLSASALAFAGLGDSFLYIVLPVYALQLNVPVVWIGILLSINRFVRIVTNQLSAVLLNRYGSKRITMAAAFFAMLSTSVYGLTPGILIWMIARIIWGFCYSAMRLSVAGYSLQNSRVGFSLGVSSGVQELGPVIALVAGPLLLSRTSLSVTFYIFSAASLISIIIARYLPELKPASFNYSFSFNMIPSLFNLLTFFLSFFVQGLLIVSVTDLIASPGLSILTVTAMAGFYLAYRRICSIFISPSGGVLADRWGIDKVYLTSLILTMSGLLLIATGYISAGIIITFTFYSILQSLSPMNAAAGASDQLKAVASNNTWSDLGAAAGVLLAGYLMRSAGLSGTFFLATFILFAACFFYSKTLVNKQKTC